MIAIAKEIFKAYDIRGVVDDTLTQDAVVNIAKAYATHANAKQVKQIVVGRDGRLSGAKLTHWLISTLNNCGIKVIDLGQIATPMLYFAALRWTDGSGIMVTGSHNPPEYNGFKMMLAQETLAGESIQALLNTILSQNYSVEHSQACCYSQDVSTLYQTTIVQDIKLKRAMTIVVDAGNGIAGKYAGALYRALGCKVIELFCEVDGNFPNHHPDPANPENLKALQSELRNSGAELGLAFDGDGDRLGVVTREGQIIYPDRLLMLFAQDVLARNPQSKVIYDVKCSRLLAPWILAHGGLPLISQTGHSYIKAMLKKEEALLAGEMSGHIFFKERWLGFDDGLYAGARLLEILSRSSHASQVLDSLPNAISTPEICIAMNYEGQAHEIIHALQTQAEQIKAEKVITIDGVRIEYSDGFGLVRASNTTPKLILRFEADNSSALHRIRQVFYCMLQPFLTSHTLKELAGTQ